MTSKFNIDNRELLQRISCGEAVVGIDFGNLIVRELAAFRLAAMDSKPVILYRQVNPVNGMKTYWAELDPEEFRHLKQHTDENAEFMTLYRHAQQPVVPVSQKEPISFDEWSRKCALQITLCYPDFREKAQYIWDSARETQHVAPVLKCYACQGSGRMHELGEEPGDCALCNGSGVLAAHSAQPAPVVPKSISVRQAISALESADAVTTIGQAYKMGWNACRAAMLAAAPQSPGSEPATVPGKWIPVSEQMPDDEQEVLTINKIGHRFVSFFDKHSGLFFDRLDAPAACCIEHVLVTHWMPLPAAPQEVNAE
ncbi:DUF551 domain-containing protein [Klebsiella variicola]|nr:DUF551 domain-containing protein [Klebsiella variicola]QOV59850.1 DUF551 domain-containing protein [Klebsiella variicola]CEP28683.1 Eaa protein [Klebsiella variicola]